MKVIFLGDVVGDSGIEILNKKLYSLKKKYNADIVIANGENSANGIGITEESSRALISAGCDIITTGNHVFRKKGSSDLLCDSSCIIRPYNYPGSESGKGLLVYDIGKARIGVFNIQGIAFMEENENPFFAADRAIDELKKETNIIIADFHAEATSEKNAMLIYLKGRISALICTHTHVQTNDLRIEEGTAYITDAGMCGSIESVLGMDAASALSRFITSEKIPYKEAQGAGMINGVYMEIDDKTGKSIACELISCR